MIKDDGALTLKTRQRWKIASTEPLSVEKYAARDKWSKVPRESAEKMFG